MGADSRFIIWISNYGQIVLFFAQLLFWLVLGVSALWATLILRRLVVAKTVEAPAGDTAAAAAAPVAPGSATNAISVDEFVD